MVQCRDTPHKYRRSCVAGLLGMFGVGLIAPGDGTERSRPGVAIMGVQAVQDGLHIVGARAPERVEPRRGPCPPERPKLDHY